jgi:hypothetical protein
LSQSRSVSIGIATMVVRTRHAGSIPTVLHCVANSCVGSKARGSRDAPNWTLNRWRRTSKSQRTARARRHSAKVVEDYRERFLRVVRRLDSVKSMKSASTNRTRMD